MTRRHDGPLAGSTDNGGSTDAVPPVWRDDGGQSPQQASSGDLPVGQAQEEALPPKVIEAITQAAMWGGLGIGSVPYTHFPGYHDTKSRVSHRNQSY